MKKLTFHQFKNIYQKYIARDKSYLVGKYSITLPYNHLLPYYQSCHKLYDVFLGFLVKDLTANSYAIDIGANCGDTLALMATNNSKINFLCVEADNYFFKFLNSNASIISNAINKRILLVNALVGTFADQVILKEVVPGTKRAIFASENEIGMASNNLDDIVNEYIDDPHAQISLIKIDTDGFDYDVINSASQIIGKFKPILFFECFFASISQLNGYKDTLENLRELGYSSFLIFDNFGAYIFETSSIFQIFEFLNYISYQSSGTTTKTIEYIDIIASTQSNHSILHSALSEFHSYLKE